MRAKLFKTHRHQVVGRPQRGAQKMRSRGLGLIIIRILSVPSKPTEVTITGGCTNPAIVAFVDEIVKLVPQRLLGAIIRRGEPSEKRRGGPIGTSQDQRIGIVAEWYRVRGRMNQEVYAQSKGISGATLRRWTRELRETGKL